MTAVKDLQLGDVITAHDFPYNCMTVVKITPNRVECVRPYVHTTDFSALANINGESGMGVIDYIGTERVVLLIDHSRPVTLLERRTNPVK
jgi:hypothetical protein